MKKISINLMQAKFHKLLMVTMYSFAIVLFLSSCQKAPTINQSKAMLLDGESKVDEDSTFEALKKVTIGREAYETIGKAYEEDASQNEKIYSSNIIDEESDSTSHPQDKDEKIDSDISSIDNESQESEDIVELDIDDLKPRDENEEGNSLSDRNSRFMSRKKNLLDIDYHTNDLIIERKIYLDKNYRFATFSEISDGSATLYIVNKKVASNFKNKIVAVNAGHGTVGGTRKRTYSHPDYTPKVAGGTNKEGSIFSAAVSDGTVLLDGKQESTANLMVAVALKEKLLNAGYSVLMIREDKNCRLDNVARTVIANENADIHIAIHFDSTERDKGIFYMKPINNKYYLSMEPLKSNVDNINRLGECLIEAFREKGEKIWKGIGYLEGDLTQIAFSTNASVDIELGDRATFLDEGRSAVFADGLLLGIEKYFAITE